MTKMIGVKEGPPTKRTGRKTPKTRTPEQTRMAQGVTKAVKKVVIKPKRTTGKPRKLRFEDEMEALMTESTQAASKPIETSTAAVSRPGANEFSATTTSNLRSQRINAAAYQSATSSNHATVIKVPRPKARFPPKERSENLGIVMADLGNYTTTASRVLGLGELEDIDFWKGAAAARNSQIRTRAVARKQDDGKWQLEFGPDTDVVCEKEGEVVIFDNMKLAMNQKSEHFQLQQEKQKKVRIKDIYLMFIEWVFLTIFDASKSADPNMKYFRVYTGLPAEWPEDVSYQYQRTIENIPGWEGKVDVHIVSEPTAAINGRLKSLLVEQRKAHKVYLEDAEHGGILDVGDATGNTTIVYSENYQATAGATELVGFGNLNKIVEGILKPSEWLKTTFGNQSITILELWMQTTFLTKYKPILGSGQQNKLEINNNTLPADLANKIEEQVLHHFDKVIDWSLGWFNDWSKQRGMPLKWIATSGGGMASVPFQKRFNGKAGPYRVFHNPEISCGEDVLDGLKQQPQLRSTIQEFQFNYGLGQDLPNEAMGESDKPQHVLVFAERHERVPEVIPSIPYYISEPHDGKWEINLTILKSDKDLSNAQPEKGLDCKVVSVDDWIELPVHNITIPFNSPNKNFGIQCFDDKGQSTHREACVYLLLQPRGIQFVVHAIGRLDGKEDVGLRNLRTTKRFGYEVNGFGDTKKYFHSITSTPTRILAESNVEPIVIDSDVDSEIDDVAGSDIDGEYDLE